MIKKYKSAALALALAALTLIAAISAANVYEISFKPNMQTGSVAIDMTPKTLDETGRLVDAVDQSVYPGERLSYMPVIENKRDDAYVRVRVSVDMAEETEEPITEANVYREPLRILTDEEVFQTIDSNDWVQIGDYFYNTKAMKKGEKSYAFQGIVIPDNWVSDPDDPTSIVPEGKTPAKASDFTISLQADAIQADNFTPDFDSNMPWGSVSIEEAKGASDEGSSTAKPLVEQNTLTFSRSGGLESNTDDLFRNFQSFSPGGEYRDDLTVKNQADNDAAVYFKVVSVPEELKDQINLTVEHEGSILYSGKMSEEVFEDYRELLTVKSGDETKLTYTLTLPKDTKNAYSLLKGTSEWRFKVVEEEGGSQDGGESYSDQSGDSHAGKDEGDSSGNKDNRSTKESSGKGHRISPKTGETIKAALWTASFVISVALLLLLIRRNRRDSEKGK